MPNYNNAANVAVAKPAVGGCMFTAPAGTAVPTDAVTPLSDEWACTGYLSEDGYTHTVTRESETKKAFGGDVVYQNQTEYGEAIGCTMIETNKVSMGVAFGDENVTEDPASGLTVIHNANLLPERAYVFETILGSRIKRLVVARGAISEVGEISHNGSDLLGYPITIGALPDSEGNYSTEYIATVAGDDAEDDPDKAIDEMTVAELRVYAATHNIPLNGASTKDDIKQAILDAQNEPSVPDNGSGEDDVTEGE